METSPTASSTTLDKGQRLVCSQCESEIEIVNPCSCEPRDQVLKCCGQDMVPAGGRTVNLGVE